MAEEKFSFESLQDRESVAQLLESITQGFRDGSVTLCTKKDSIILTPSNLLDFTIKAKQKSGESKLEIRIFWKENSSKRPKKRSTLCIGSE